MLSFVARRVLSLIPTLFCMATLLFFMVRLAPGNPFETEKQVPVEVRAEIDKKIHLNDPIPTQYKFWLVAVVRHGDLGPTIKYPNRSVNEIIALSLPVSMELGAMAMLLALLTGIPLGIVGAVRQNSWKDSAAMGIAMVGVSVPSFVLASLFVFVFAMKLYILPVARWETWRHMIMPVICLAGPTAAYIARLTRGGMLEVIRSDFVRTARAKGLSEMKVIRRHALRGGLLPVVSFLGPGFSGLFVGSLVIERIFGIPGMGRYFVDAALNRDYFLIVGIALVYGVILAVFNTLVDIAYVFLDPRVELR